MRRKIVFSSYKEIDNKWKLNIRYKSNLENVRRLEEIQWCYELEYEAALALFGRPKTCWIKQTYIQSSEERGL